MLVERSVLHVDLGRSGETPRRCYAPQAGAELWAIVKAEGYGHGAVDVSRAALDGGASALCVATLSEALHLRAALRNARVIVMGPVSEREIGEAKTARLELVAADGRVPEGLRVHLKVDTGMGRWGLAELPAPGRDVVGLMSHLASAESDPAFTHLQVERFKEATAGHGSLTRHIANSAATLRYAEARFDAVRCGIALYGISPFDAGPQAEGLEPALRWESYLALVKQLPPGASTGYGRRFVADRPTWIGIVPVGYADGFRRDMTGTEVFVEGARRRVVGTISMDALAVELDQQFATGTPVTLVGDGVLVEEHARVAGTIGYEIATGLNTRSGRARRVAKGSSA
jgi:alanine racemase